MGADGKFDRSRNHASGILDGYSCVFNDYFWGGVVAMGWGVTKKRQARVGIQSAKEKIAVLG